MFRTYTCTVVKSMLGQNNNKKKEKEYSERMNMIYLTNDLYL